MKKQVIVLVVVSLLALCQATQAADLQAGWYVHMNQISVWGERWPDPPQFIAWAQFSTPIGQYGPFTVDNPYPYTDGSRYITVTNNSYGAGPEQSLVLPTDLSAYGGSYNWINIDWATNYNPNDMMLEFWKTRSDGTDELLGVWTGQGHVQGETQVPLGSETGSSYYFKIAVTPVPEPSAFVTLFSALGCFASVKKWKKH